MDRSLSFCEPPFTFSAFSSNLKAIADVASLTCSIIRMLFVGRYAMMGNIAEMARRISSRSPLLSLRDLNTLTIGDSWPSRALKSCPNPAIPIESSLSTSAQKDIGIMNAKNRRDFIHPVDYGSISTVIVRNDCAPLLHINYGLIIRFK